MFPIPTLRLDGVSRLDDYQLMFAGPMDNPGLDIRATRTSGDVVPGIEITGTLKSPRTGLFSDPPMSEAEVLSCLATGNPLSGTESSDSQAMAAGVDVGIRSGETDADTAMHILRCRWASRSHPSCTWTMPMASSMRSPRCTAP